MSQSARKQGVRNRALLPGAILGVGVALWFALGAWIVNSAPFASGTDESIRYVAFAAAKNRWATEEDFRTYGIEQFYYPPLYFLLFAPFYNDDPVFVEGFPPNPEGDIPLYKFTGRVLYPREWSESIPQQLLRLYRSAKMLSLSLGLITVLSLVGTLRLVLRGRYRHWAVLAGTVPLVFLPQFLYYQTLCNNDCLMNALGGLAIYGAVAAMTALRVGRHRSFVWLAVFSAACVGLSLLTKMTGLALLGLLPGLAGALYLRGESEPVRVRLARSLKLLLILAAVAFLAGGWWLLYKGLQGDWSSQGAHRLAHSWTFRKEFPPDPWHYANDLLNTVRSYFALFGSLIGIPDRIFLLYLAVPTFLTFALGVLGVRSARTKAGTAARSRRRALARWPWLVLGITFLLNVLLVLGNLVISAAPFGRLLFPSLVASHALFVLAVVRVTRGPGPRLPAVAIALTLFYGLLFGWTFRYRMADAVRVRQEDMRPLAYLKEGWENFRILGPVWRGRIEQPVVLPPGRLTGMRVQIVRFTDLSPGLPRFDLPQVGASLEGALDLLAPGTPPRRVRLVESAIGDNDATERWTAVTLQEPVTLAVETPATLMLWGKPPWLVGSFVSMHYVLAPTPWFPGMGSLRGLGFPGGYSLCVGAVYGDSP